MSRLTWDEYQNQMRSYRGDELSWLCHDRDLIHNKQHPDPNQKVDERHAHATLIETFNDIEAKLLGKELVL